MSALIAKYVESYQLYDKSNYHRGKKPHTTTGIPHKQIQQMHLQMDYYRINVVYGFIDHVVSELDTRFGESEKLVCN